MGYGEYLYLMEIYHKRQQDDIEAKLFEAWISARVAVAQKKNGQYVYKSFDEFKRIVNRDEVKKADFAELRRLAKIQQQHERGGNA